MAATGEKVASAARVPGPPELLPGRPDAIVDLQADDGAALVARTWRYSDARVEEIDFVELAGPGAVDPLAPGDVRTARTTSSRTPRRWTSTTRAGSRSRRRHAAAAVDRARVLQLVPHRGHDPGARRRLGSGVDRRVRGRDRRLRRGLGRRQAAARARGRGGRVVAGFNAPEPRRPRPATRGRESGSRWRCSASTARSPRRRATTSGCATATLDFYAPERAVAAAEIESSEATGGRRDRAGRLRLERVAGGFEFTEGPVWSPDGALLFGSPNTNAIYARRPSGGAERVPLQERLAGVESGATTSPNRTGWRSIAMGC